MSTGSGSVRLEATDSGATYTALVAAKVKERTVNFAVTIRYQSDVRMEMSYTVMEDGAQKPCVLTCENKKTVNADPVYDDQLTDGLLTYTFAIRGEEASDVTIQSVKCYQSGSFKTITLPAPSGSVTLLLNEDKTGDNTFTVTAASSGGDSYTFVFNVPYKHRGENKVQIKTNLRDGATITNGQEVNLTVEAWTEDAAGNRVSHILATGTETKLTVQLDGKDVQFESTSGYVQQYLLIPENLDEGDRNEHTLYIYAEDEKGNYGELNLKLIGKRTEEGQKIGTASIYIDMSILGLGVRGPISYDVLSKEPVSYVIAKAISAAGQMRSAGVGTSSAARRMRSLPGSTAASARTATKRSSGAASTATVSRCPAQAPASVNLTTQWVPAGCIPSAARRIIPVRPCRAII